MSEKNAEQDQESKEPDELKSEELDGVQGGALSSGAHLHLFGRLPNRPNTGSGSPMGGGSGDSGHVVGGGGGDTLYGGSGGHDTLYGD